MKKTFEELREADTVVANLYMKNPKLKEGKFGYGWSKFYKKNLEPTYTEMQEKMADAKVENAMVDEKTKELLYDITDPHNKSYKYTKEGMKKLTEEFRKIVKEYDTKEVEVEPYFIKDTKYIPEMLDEERELLTNLIINIKNGK
jgi:hypothetical protein